jgi:hypothetical protein
MNKSDTNVIIPPFFQKIFISAALSVWLVQLVLVLFTSFGQNGVPIVSIWLYQVSAWGLPVLFFILTLVFLRIRYKGWQLLFWATFLATVGDLIYVCLQTIEQGSYQLYLRNHTIPSTGSFWTSQASVWLALIVVTFIFVTGLVYIQKRKV